MPWGGGGIDAMEADLYKKLVDLIKPLTEQITQLNLSIQETAKLAEGVMDMSICPWHSRATLEPYSRTLKPKLKAILTNRQRFFNLKFRGLQENAEGNTNLYAFML